LERGADINGEDSRGSTPLIATASQGFGSIVRELMKHDARSGCQHQDIFVVVA
jgi:ankyrin repeat protein